MHIRQKLSELFDYNKNQQIQAHGISAKSGAVAAAHIATGAAITVNNISVSDRVISHYAAPLKRSLTQAEAEAVSRDFLSDIETRQ